MRSTIVSAGAISFATFFASNFVLAQMDTRQVEVSTDVSYLGDEREETMDIYVPVVATNKKKHPAVLYIHGGGWALGSKSSARAKSISHTLSQAGYAVFSIDYKLTKFAGAEFKTKIEDPGWPQNIYDCKSALRYIRKNASKYDVDSERIGVMGCSAGGHLALLTALSAKNEALNSGGLYGDVSNQVACVISFYGIPDVRTWGGDSFMGVSRKKHAYQWELASPITHLSNQTPPVMLVHGDQDEVVDAKLSLDFADALEERKLQHELVIVKGGKHSFELETKQQDLTSEVLDFLEKHL